MSTASLKSNLQLYDTAGEAKFVVAVSGAGEAAVSTVTVPAFKIVSGSSTVDNVATQLLGNTAAIADEISIARAAEAANANAISAEVLARENAITGERSTTAANLAAEALARTNADNTHTADITAANTAIASEASTARAAEGVNAAAITAEATTARAAEAANAANITTEATTRIAAVAAEATARTAAIAAQEVLAAEARTTIQSNVDTEKGRIDAILNLSSAELDTFKEIADAYTAADSSLTALITAVTDDLAQLRADFDAHIYN